MHVQRNPVDAIPGTLVVVCDVDVDVWSKEGYVPFPSRENGISILWVSVCECETISNQELGLGDLYVVKLFV